MGLSTDTHTHSCTHSCTCAHTDRMSTKLISVHAHTLWKNAQIVHSYELVKTVRIFKDAIVCSTDRHLQQKPSFSSSSQAVCPLWSTPWVPPQPLPLTEAPAATRGREHFAGTCSTCEVWTQLGCQHQWRTWTSFSESCSCSEPMLVLACPG